MIKIVDTGLIQFGHATISHTSGMKVSYLLTIIFP